jgi:hypothetical protein
MSTGHDANGNHTPQSCGGIAAPHNTHICLTNSSPAGGSRKAGKRGVITLADYPKIVGWWHPSKNGDKQPSDFTHGSHKWAWLQCDGCQSCGELHEWEAQAHNMTAYGGGIACPFCIPRYKRICRCKTVAENTLLAGEWHEDNPSSATVASGSQQDCKWRCSNAACGHVWEDTPQRRNIQGGGCPVCS